MIQTNLIHHQDSTKKSVKLLDQVRDLLRLRHYSYRTEKTYIHWIKRFIFFHNIKRVCPSFFTE